MNYFKIIIVVLLLSYTVQGRFRKPRGRRRHVMRHRGIQIESSRNGPLKFRMEIAPSGRNQQVALGDTQDLGEIVEEANEAVKAAEAMNTQEEPWKQKPPGSGLQNDFSGDFSQLESLKGTIDVNEKALSSPIVPIPCTSEMNCGQKSELDSTLQNALPILQKISEAIQANKGDFETTETPTSRNDFPCSIDGLWISNVGGVKLKLTILGDGKVQASTTTTEVPHAGDLQNCAWHLSGLVPSRREGPFALAAVCSQQHRIATFVGQCKICEEKETIFGTWMFSRISRDCSEVMSAVEMKPDVWRKDHMLQMKEHRLQELAKEKKMHNTTLSTCAPVVDLGNTIGRGGY